MWYTLAPALVLTSARTSTVTSVGTFTHIDSQLYLYLIIFIVISTRIDLYSLSFAYIQLHPLIYTAIHLLTSTYVYLRLVAS